MSNLSGAPSSNSASGVGNAPRTVWSETKSAVKTTEFYAWIVVSLAILIASAVVDKGDDGQGFGAAQAWSYVALVTAAYVISRGIAKAGTHRHESENGNH
jgi:hypothetical protein